MAGLKRVELDASVERLCWKIIRRRRRFSVRSDHLYIPRKAYTSQVERRTDATLLGTRDFVQLDTDKNEPPCINHLLLSDWKKSSRHFFVSLDMYSWYMEKEISVEA